jgi:hypothetical protein
MKRLGSADIGVSISLLFPKLPLVAGGGGLAKGFGGPVAPALIIAPALGDGGGRTGPWPGSRIGVSMFAGSRSMEVSAVFSSSEVSKGICTFSLGRLTSD